MSNYPDGTLNDKDAPWNYREPVMTEWDKFPGGACKCIKCGEVKETDADYICETCFNPEPITQEDEWL